ncbi:cytosolic endo-beta-N-acetylglucosaminidase-like [Dermacentor variabilis]|uniref:cytosolic endo-beta-N-acetylglucosaminidase-like n=1 Tax=Dermacentor variabilis TaxID=34621 RepID=UPI003F5B8ED2
MGIQSSRAKRGPPEVREMKWEPDREAAPLRTLDELLAYKEQPFLCAVEPLSDAIKRGKPEDPRTIFCHDMGGGYNEDRFIHGCHERHVYRFHHWQIIDTFIHYSHHMVTIPPPGWISAAHKHGVKVLGTFILGKDDGKTIDVVKGSGLVPQIAAQLARVAFVGRFDGWLISIGCEVDPCFVPFLKDSLRAITTEMHKAVPGSLVLWYDAVDVNGKAKPHNELNEKNSCFLDLCDGIFLNFRWTKTMLQRLWNFPDDCCSEWRLTKLPLSTSFCQGFGSKVFVAGKITSNLPWFNLHQQQLQPRDQGPELRDSCCSVTLHTHDGYNGGGSLHVLFEPNLHCRHANPYIRLFGCDFPLSPLVVSYTFKNISSVIAIGQDIAIVLKAKTAAGEMEDICLGVTVGLPEGDNYTVTWESSRRPADNEGPSGTYWLTRKYQLGDRRGADGAILVEVGLHLFSVNREANVCLLGQLDISRPAAEIVIRSNDDSDDDYEPEMKRQRYDQDGVESIEFE